MKTWTLNSPGFCALICTSAVVLYSQTFLGGYGYVWDDRAAIVSNKDVTGESAISEVFLHDFWGQDIKAKDSHKSYRPLTTLSYRLNHNIHGLHASGFHFANVLIYAIVVGLVYLTSRQWLSSVLAARVAAILFCFHPVHVEAVSNLVGRADCLCCLFYLVAACSYTSALRSSMGGPFRWLLPVVSSLCACLTKEIGVTIFGMLVVLEIAHAIKLQQSGAETRTQSLIMGFRGCLRACQICISSWGSCLRISIIFLALGFLSVARVRLNGQNVLYSWTLLENHIHLLPGFFERTLSYAQTHFWYAAKLLFPRYLCFDYGYACIPTVHSLADARNLLPLATYGSLVAIIVAAIRRQRVSLLVGLAMLLLPLVPALNALFPIGTTLAERLLFVPSVGFCMMVGEALAEDCSQLWPKLGAMLGLNSSRVDKENVAGGRNDVRFSATCPPLLALFTGCLCLLGAARSVTRSADWASEMQIYRSALFVCPLSAKALTNYAVLCAQDSRSLKQSFHNCLAAAHTALDVHSGQLAAYINTGVVHTKLTGRLLHAIWYYRQATRTPTWESGHAKAQGYYGVTMLEWLRGLKLEASAASVNKNGTEIEMESQEATESSAESSANEMSSLVASAESFVMRDALQALDDALNQGFEPPSVLLARARAALSIENSDLELDLARRCLELGKAKVEHERSLSPDVPHSDSASLFELCETLAEVYTRLGQHERALGSRVCANNEKDKQMTNH